MGGVVAAEVAEEVVELSEQRQIQHVRYGMHLLHRVSPSLQVQIAFYVFADFVNVPFFCADDLHERREFIGRLSLLVRPRLWCPGFSGAALAREFMRDVFW